MAQHTVQMKTALDHHARVKDARSRHAVAVTGAADAHLEQRSAAHLQLMVPPLPLQPPAARVEALPFLKQPQSQLPPEPDKCIARRCVGFGSGDARRHHANLPRLARLPGPGAYSPSQVTLNKGGARLRPAFVEAEDSPPGCVCTKGILVHIVGEVDAVPNRQRAPKHAGIANATGVAGEMGESCEARGSTRQAQPGRRRDGPSSRRRAECGAQASGGQLRLPQKPKHGGRHRRVAHLAEFVTQQRDRAQRAREVAAAAAAAASDEGIVRTFDSAGLADVISPHGPRWTLPTMPGAPL